MNGRRRHPYLRAAPAALLAAALAVPAARPARAEEKGTARLVDGLPEGYRLVDGDMLLPVGSSKMLDEEPWPGGIVRYAFGDEVGGTNRFRSLEAMQELIAVTGVAFVPVVDEGEPYCLVRNALSNSAVVGWREPGQLVRIRDWDSHFIIVHELIHVLGFRHEQGRPDRDDYVDIIEINIEDNEGHNFEISEDAETFGHDYDFDSVMHYGQCHFSACEECPLCDDAPSFGRTIVAKPGYEQYQWTMGQRTHLSDGDVIDLREVYGGPIATYVNGVGGPLADGSITYPHAQVAEGDRDAPAGGVIVIEGGTYRESGVYTKRARWLTHSGTVVIR